MGRQERFTILAPSQKKAEIIMGYIIDHVFDQQMFTEQLELDPNESLDRLKRRRSRDHITFRNGGGIMTLTLDAKNSRRSIEAAMGFGGNRIILDESSLIDDPLYATVKRMLGGYNYKDQFLLEIGNPFYRNHFYRTWHSSYYHKVFIDYHTGLKEGRYSPEFIEEMRQEAFFDIFYECVFPDEEQVDSKGYRTLISIEKIVEAYVDSLPEEIVRPKLGVDIGGGGDYNVYALRTPDVAWIYGNNRSNDTMTNVIEIEKIIQEYDLIPEEDVFIDDTGIGKGVSDRLRELGYYVNAVTVGSKAQDETRYRNLKAEAFWNTRLWLMAGGKLLRDDTWQQLNWIKYKVNTDKVLQTEPKDEMKKRTGKSPDFADALMLTFTPMDPIPSIRVID